MWSQAVPIGVGIWLMAPAVLRYGGNAATSDHAAGPILAAIALVAMSQVSRGVRRLNLVTGAWLLAAPVVLGSPPDAAVSSSAVGALAFLIAPRGRPDQNRYGGGWLVLLDAESDGAASGSTPGIESRRATSAFRRGRRD